VIGPACGTLFPLRVAAGPFFGFGRFIMRTLRLHHLAAAALIALPAAATAQTVDMAAPSPFAAAGAIDEAALGSIAGREDTQQEASAVQTATVTRNSVGDHVSTGEARIDDNAFQNMSGLSILNVNTGNNVAINAAMNVTISISPGQ
jgi:hypothetical protein